MAVAQPEAVALLRPQLRPDVPDAGLALADIDVELALRGLRRQPLPGPVFQLARRLRLQELPRGEQPGLLEHAHLGDEPLHVFDVLGRQVGPAAGGRPAGRQDDLHPLVAARPDGDVLDVGGVDPPLDLGGEVRHLLGGEPLGPRARLGRGGRGLRGVAERGLAGLRPLEVDLVHEDGAAGEVDAQPVLLRPDREQRRDQARDQADQQPAGEIPLHGVPSQKSEDGGQTTEGQTTEDGRRIGRARLFSSGFCPLASVL